jgi:hypothetical protein
MSSGFKLAIHPTVSAPEVSRHGLAISAGNEYFVAVEPGVTNADAEIYHADHEKRNCYLQVKDN